jgi:hypothetical protein
MTLKYNTHGISPKQFLLAVMWEETVDLSLRIDAADKLRHWIERGDFREPDLGYSIGELVLQ